MFGYLRLFSILSLLSVTGLAALAGTWFRTMATEDLSHMFEKNNAALVQGYVNAVWQHNREVILPLSLGTAPQTSQAKDNPQLLQFARETLNYFQQMPLLRINIYSANGKLLMTGNISKGEKLPASPASPDTVFVLTQMNQTHLGSHIISGLEINGSTKTQVLQTLVPIRSGANDNSGPPEGAVEILYDVTEPWEKLWYSQLYGTGGIVVVFLAFLVILSFTSRRTEAIITKQHEANLELAETAAAAQAETLQKSQFLANVSHELRTPLNAIIGFSDIIKNEVIATIHDQKYHDYINDIHSAGVHLLSLINDILDFSKAEAGKLELEVEEVNATKMIHNCIRLVLPRAESGHVKIIEAMPKDACILITDTKKFKQVMLNLLSNAVKFTPEGGEVRIGLWRNVMDNSCTFEVADNGIGIAPKDISRAMSPFGQVDNTLKRKYEGTGLGLPLTKKFVELMGGKFTIESKLGEGTSITFTLPQEIAPRDDVIIKHL